MNFPLSEIFAMLAFSFSMAHAVASALKRGLERSSASLLTGAVVMELLVVFYIRVNYDAYGLHWSFVPAVLFLIAGPLAGAYQFWRDRSPLSRPPFKASWEDPAAAKEDEQQVF